MEILDVMNSLYSAEGYWRCEVCEERVCWEGMGVQGQQQDLFDRQFHYGCMNM